MTFLKVLSQRIVFFLVVFFHHVSRFTLHVFYNIITDCQIVACPLGSPACRVPPIRALKKGACVSEDDISDLESLRQWEDW